MNRLNTRPWEQGTSAITGKEIVDQIEAYRQAPFNHLLRSLGDVGAIADSFVDAPSKWDRFMEIRRAAGDYLHRNITDTGENQLGPLLAQITGKEVGPWRSKLMGTVAAKMPNAMPSTALAQQIKGWQLPGEGPVTNEQIDWSGLPEWLAEKGGKVTKDEVQKYLKENDLQLEEIVKGSKEEWPASYYEAKNELEELGYSVDEFSISKNGERVDTTDPTHEDFMLFLELQSDENQPLTQTKFSQYQIPGGENYREMTINIPGPDMGYKVPSAHSYGDKADLNRLAHVRFNDRTGPNGEKVLFIEELQSDWHQEGRKKGYEDPKNTPEENKRKWDAIYARHAAGEIDFTERHRLIEAVPGVPDAPWKKTWPLKAFQRMVRYAAENGYDSISWTPGEVQADRYDLSKYIETISTVSSGPDDATRSYQMTVVGKDGRELTGIPRYLTGSELEDHIGKEMAEKIIEGSKTNPYQTFSGLDLKVGGEGMKGFYDKILPAEVNKFFNKAKWGNAKVGVTKIVTSKIDAIKGDFLDQKEQTIIKEVWTLPITPEMKSKALGEGFWSSQREKPGLMGAYA